MINRFYFKSRSDDPELMDNPLTDKKKLINTIIQFNVINFLFTRSRFLIKKYIIKDILKNKNREYSFLDLGAGGGDNSIWFAGYCRKKRINAKIYCLDYDRRIIGFLKERIEKSGFKNIKVIYDDVFNLKKIGSFDYIFTNHFLHHFDDKNILKILEIISACTKKVFVLDDVIRSKIVYFLYSLFSGIFLHNSFAFYDGRLSIKKGFIENELKSLINKAGNKNKLKLKKFFLGRIVIVNA
jgi:2-polyprenyl-3-methyl-5-hydroxy-6-metoxy-1,4-benzoquinol methylase